MFDRKEMFSRKRKTVNLNTEAIDLKYTQAIAAKTLMRMRLQAGFVTPDRNLVIRTWPYEGMGAGAPATGERYLLPSGRKSSPPVRLRNILAHEEAPQQTRFRAAVAAVAMGTVVAHGLDDDVQREQTLNQAECNFPGRCSRVLHYL
jgi:hypothetical protein